MAKVRAAVQADPAVAGRLALWARRLLGEAVTQAQHVIAERESLDALFMPNATTAASAAATAAAAAATLDLAEIKNVIERLTDKHYQRMFALGLAKTSERA
jgi:precorrin-4 methylase